MAWKMTLTTKREGLSVHKHVQMPVWMNIYICGDTHTLSLRTIVKVVNCENGITGIIMPPSSVL